MLHGRGWIRRGTISCHVLQLTHLENNWLMDSDCTKHITHDRELFEESNKSDISKVRIGNRDQIVL